MHSWTARAASTALLAAAITAAGAGIANADDTTRGDQSVLGGNQVSLPVTVPIGIQGNSVGLLNNLFGRSGARLSNVSMRDNEPAGGVTVCGNAISSVGGIGTAACKGRATVSDEGNAPAAPAAAKADWAAPAAQAAPALAAPESQAAGVPTGLIGAPGAPIAPPAPPVTTPDAPAKADAPAKVDTPAKADMAIKADAPAAVPADMPATTVPAADTSAMDKPGAFAADQAQIQAPTPARPPVNICGNAGAAGGVATATCEGRATIRKHGGSAIPALGLIS